MNVRMKGLEPPCLAALDPKSSASTNFATSADKTIKRFAQPILKYFVTNPIRVSHSQKSLFTTFL